MCVCVCVCVCVLFIHNDEMPIHIAISFIGLDEKGEVKKYLKTEDQFVN